MSDDSEKQSASSQTVGTFFDALTDDYAAAIERCFPRYREMLWALLEYLPADREFESILELGSGTGNLSVLLKDEFPGSKLHCVDVSGDSLEVCRSRLGADERFHFLERDFRNLDFPAGSFDLVISSISVHHLTSVEKKSMFDSIHGWLTPRGIFSFADQFAGAASDLTARHTQGWKVQAMSAGSSDEEWEMWMQHQAEHDHHDTLPEQIDWLRDAGFSMIDCVWRYLLWTVVQARKS